MKKKILGVFFAGAMAAILAACVYDDAGVAITPPTDQEPAVTANPFPIAVGATFDTQGQAVRTVTSAPIGGAHGTPEQDAWQVYNGLGNMTWRRGPMTVEVDFSENQILDIRLVSHGESAYGAMYLFRAYPMVPDFILVEQSTQNLRMTDGRASADTVFVGGTATQASIVNAVEDAIRQAGADPLALVPQVATAPLSGDRFVPGTHTVYVPADQYVFNFNTRQFSVASEVFPDWPVNSGDQPNDAFGGIRGTTNPDGYGRVLFNAPSWGRNNGANHAPSLFDTTRAGTIDGVQNVLVEAVVNNVSREMGFDPTNNPFYNDGAPLGLFLTVNFGRNYFQIAEHASGDGLGTAGSGGAARPFSGESLAPNREGTTYGVANIQTTGINGSTSSQALGGYWWIQTAHRTINDRQSTLWITPDSYTGATQSALGVVHGVEQAIRLAGGNPANLTPRAHGDSPFWREPHEDGLNLVPGRYVIDIPGYDIQMAVTLCRTAIRYLAFIHPETGSHVSHAIGSNADNPLGNPENATFIAQAELLGGITGAEWTPGHWALTGIQDNPSAEAFETSFRGRLLFAFAETFGNGGRTAASLEVEPMPGQEAFSTAIIQALQTLVTEQSYNYGNFNQTGRLGTELVASPFR